MKNKHYAALPPQLRPVKEEDVAGVYYYIKILPNEERFPNYLSKLGMSVIAIEEDVKGTVYPNWLILEFIYDE